MAFVIIIIVIIGVLLGAVVLIQNPKGGGLSGSFGGVGQQLLGARRSTDIIEKLTWGFAAGLLLLCLVSTTLIGKEKKVAPGAKTTTTEKSGAVNEILKRTTPTAPAAAPEQPTAPAAATGNP